jgi:DNA repair and recombination protein RAD54B
MFKPFKPPLLKSVAELASIDLTESDDEPLPHPSKKRKLLIHVVEDSPPPARAPSSAVLAPRKPLLVVKNPMDLKSTQDAAAESPEGYYIVLWYEVN